MDSHNYIARRRILHTAASQTLRSIAINANCRAIFQAILLIISHRSLVDEPDNWCFRLSFFFSSFLFRPRRKSSVGRNLQDPIPRYLTGSLGGGGREDREVTGCPFGFRRSTPGPSLYCKEIPCSGHAIEKEGKSAKNSVFGAELISPLQLKNDAQNAKFGPQSHLNMKLNPRRMFVRTMMTPKVSELIKNGGARKMWWFSIFIIFSI